MRSSTIFAIEALAAVAAAYDLPDNLRAIYEAHKAGSCENALSDVSSTGAVFCGDIPNALFLKGGDGDYDNMDVDCDGVDDKAGDCSNDPSGYGETSFKDTVSSYGISDLNANIHTYVVFNELPYFDPTAHGMEPLSVMAVVCNDQVWYGVWGDTNQEPTTGETSIALAQLCFPDEGLTGDNGHGDLDVMYIGFAGSEAVPGKDGADWAADNTDQFEESIKALGDELVASLES